MPRSIRYLIIVAVLVALASDQCLRSVPAAAAAAPPRILTYKETIEGVAAVRLLHLRKEYEKCEMFAARMLWSDIRRPEVMYLLGSAIDWQDRAAEAGAWYTLYLQSLRDDLPETDTRYRKAATNRLRLLKLDAATVEATYAATAKAKRFAAPEQVDDVWMNNVQAEPVPLRALRFWKAIATRPKDKPADWPHSRYATMHRSGMKHLEQFEGRKGILFGVTKKDDADAQEDDRDEENGQRTQSQRRSAANGARPAQHDNAADEQGKEKPTWEGTITARNIGGGKVLRIGIRADGAPVELIVRAGDQEVARELIQDDAWSDLKFDLPPAAIAAPTTAPTTTAPAAAPAVVIQLLRAPDQRPTGAWIDYIDFFED